MRLRFVDLFCGIGGFHQALSTHADLVHACDIDADCRKVYTDNFDNIPGDDIRIVKENIVAHDILTAGFPCQPFSKSGSQLGFLDKIRGTLFEDIMDIVRLHSPSVIVLENVRNFETHDEGRTLAIVRGALDSEDYDVKECILSPHQFGIPQIRQRIFIVALHKGKVSNYYDFQFPEPTGEAYDVESLRETSLGKDVEDNYKITAEQLGVFAHWSKLVKAVLSNGKKFPSPTWSMEFGRTYSLDGKFPLADRTNKQLCDELRKDRKKVSEGWKKEDLIALYPPYIRSIKQNMPEWKKRFIENNRNFWNENKGLVPKNWLKKTRLFKDTYQKLEWHVGGDAKDVEEYDIMKWMIHLRPSGIRVSKLDHIPALVAISQIPIIGPWGRKLTPREAANAQSFDPGYKLSKTDSIAYKQLGNSVNVDVVRRILSEILKLNISPIDDIVSDDNTVKAKHEDFVQ
jgi:DNA (cytosine-5)-methyltransferase 1